MAGSFTRNLQRKLIMMRGRSDIVSERAKRTLIKSLYTQPSTLAIGAFNGIASTAIAAWVSGIHILYLGCIFLTVIAIARVTAAVGMSPDEEDNSTRKLELIYEIGAFSYAFLIGLIAALTIVLDAPAGVEVLMTANALCYGVGICARNAGSPNIAIGQLSLVSLPIMTAALWMGSLAFLALFVNILLLIPAMISITLNVFHVLRDSISAAETSAQLAQKMQALARTDVVTWSQYSPILDRP